MATIKTIRQVKTVFIIFIAFVCCWSPYVVVLLCDSSNSLPLPVHLYTSMLAHLHASLNFAIYGLMNRNLRAGLVAHLLACCRQVTSRNTDVAAAAAAAGGGGGDGTAVSATITTVNCSVVSHRTNRRTRSGAVHNRHIDVSRSVVAVEYYQLRQADG